MHSQNLGQVVIVRKSNLVDILGVLNKSISNFCAMMVSRTNCIFCSIVRYENLRQKYIPSKYCVVSNANKFNILMASSTGHTIQAVGSYLYHAFKLC